MVIRCAFQAKLGEAEGDEAGRPPDDACKAQAMRLSLGLKQWTPHNMQLAVQGIMVRRVQGV